MVGELQKELGVCVTLKNSPDSHFRGGVEGETSLRETPLNRLHVP